MSAKIVGYTVSMGITDQVGRLTFRLEDATVYDANHLTPDHLTSLVQVLRSGTTTYLNSDPKTGYTWLSNVPMRVS
jgi:hypothetical protein